MKKKTYIILVIDYGKGLSKSNKCKHVELKQNRNEEFTSVSWEQKHKKKYLEKFAEKKLTKWPIESNKWDTQILKMRFDL